MPSPCHHLIPSQSSAIIPFFLLCWTERVQSFLSCQKPEAHKVGKLWKFRKEEVDAWVRQGTAEGKRRSKR